MELTSLEKTTGEEATFNMSFLDKLADNDAIFSVTSITIELFSGTGLATSENVAILTGKVSARYVGGVDGSKYLVTIKITTTNGDTLEKSGLLEVKNPTIPT